MIIPEVGIRLRLLECGGDRITDAVSRKHFRTDVLDTISPVLGTDAEQVNAEAECEW